MSDSSLKKATLGRKMLPFWLNQFWLKVFWLNVRRVAASGPPLWPRGARRKDDTAGAPRPATGACEPRRVPHRKPIRAQTQALAMSSLREPGPACRRAVGEQAENPPLAYRAGPKYPSLEIAKPTASVWALCPPSAVQFSELVRLRVTNVQPAISAGYQTQTRKLALRLLGHMCAPRVTRGARA